MVSWTEYSGKRGHTMTGRPNPSLIHIQSVTAVKCQLHYLKKYEYIYDFIQTRIKSIKFGLRGHVWTYGSKFEKHYVKDGLNFSTLLN